MSGDEEQIANIFEEPGDYYRKTPSHTFQAFYFADGTELRLRLVGQSPLWVRKFICVDFVPCT